MSERPNFITPDGYRKLREEYDALYGGERPKLLETIVWAAANGDRSENADYQYGRRRLREVDRRINFLARRMKEAKVTDPSKQPDKSRIWFGATVTLADEQDNERIVTLVGEDEADAGAGRISFHSPIARAVRGAAVGDVRRVVLPAGAKDYEVIAIGYPDSLSPAGRGLG